MNTFKNIILLLLVCFFLVNCTQQQNKVNLDVEASIRFASYNVSMYGDTAGQVLSELSSETPNERFSNLAKIIQEVQPEVLVLMELDYHAEGQVAKLFHERYLSVSQDEGSQAMEYPYIYQVPTNTGMITPIDFDANGEISLPNDAFGFGRYPGQYASAIFSKFPIDLENIRTFQYFLWKDMPNAALPTKENGDSYYSDAILDEFRLSSKNHADVPLKLPNNREVHIIISHPTPPVFDGTEDRNGKRNHDEIRLIADYIGNEAYLEDDKGIKGGLTHPNFIIMGDLNADPMDGDSYKHAIHQLTNNPRINSAISNGDLIPKSNGGKEHNRQPDHKGDPAYDTSIFGMRIDYVLPSKAIQVKDSGVFWPTKAAQKWDFMWGENAVTDHFLVWADLSIK